MKIEYQNWLENPTSANLNKVVESAGPVITSEIQRYAGPKPLLRARAKLLTAKAIRNFDPTKGASLRTWVVWQLQPLTRYSHYLKPVRVSEDTNRLSAAINTAKHELTQELGREPNDTELADHTGVNVNRLRSIKAQVKPVLAESFFDSTGDDDEIYAPALHESSGIDFASEAIYDSLDPRTKSIYDLKTGLHGSGSLTNQDIAKRFGMSPAAVSQISGDISKRILEAQQNVI